MIPRSARRALVLALLLAALVAIVSSDTLHGALLDAYQVAERTSRGSPRSARSCS